MVQAAVKILKKQMLDEELIGLIIDCCRDQYPSARQAAVDVLGSQKVPSPAALDALKALDRDTDENVRNAAIKVLKEHSISLA